MIRAILEPYVGAKLARPQRVAIDLHYWPGVAKPDADIRSVDDNGVGVFWWSGEETIPWDDLYLIVVRHLAPNGKEIAREVYESGDERASWLRAHLENSK